MEEKKKRGWMKIAALAFCAVLLVMNFWQGQQLKDIRRQLGYAQNDIMNNVNALSSQVHSLYADLERADNAVLDWDCAASVDMENRRLNMEVTMELREWSEDTTVQVVWENLHGKGLEGIASLTSDQRGGYYGTIELPSPERLNEISMTAVITNGGVSRRENLGSLGSAYDLLPIRCFGHGFNSPDYSAKEGTFALSYCDADLDGDALALDRVTGQTFRLTRNGKTVAEQAAKQADRLDSYVCEELLSTECQPGDELVLTFCCRDEYGLGYEFFLNGWNIIENGFGDAVSEWEFPKLTWD